MNQSDHNSGKDQTFVPLTSGTIVSHYQILEKIGSGGMGEVYLAEDTKLNRKAALKFMPPYLVSDENARARFTREAQAVAMLNHPNIITIYEVSEYHGRPFFAMEHVQGDSLDCLISGGKLTLGGAIDIAAHICEGLDEAHRAGVVHRDVKPSNILIDSHGRAKLLDFGLATIQGSKTITKTGSTLGTVRYMSPEQARGEKVDHRSDLFSFGSVLYEMITGRPPFKGEHEAEEIYEIIHQTPQPVARFCSDAPDELQWIVDKALDKNVQTRYQHADEILADLRRLKAQWKPRKESRYHLWLATTIIVMVGGFFGYKSVFVDESASEQPVRTMLAVLPFENLGAPDDEYFADGITDEITSRLAKLSGLGVISRTSTIQYKSTDKGIPQIASELGVDFVLEGTIRWDKSSNSDKVRITPQLIRVSDNTHLWAESYEREMSAIFAVQIDIASQIVSALDINLLKSERDALGEKPTENPEAYHAYLAGMKHGYNELAIQMIHRAIEYDSNFALAYVYLSRLHTGRFHYGYDRTQEGLRLAKSAAERALTLKPELPEAHLALGYYYYQGYREYDKALKELSIAEKSLPNNPLILRAKAVIWRRKARFEDAVSALEKAFQFDPQNVVVAITAGETYTIMRRYQEAMRYIDRAIVLRPDIQVSYFEKAEIHIFQGELSLARSIFDNAPLVGDQPPIKQPLRVRLSIDIMARRYEDALARLADAPDDFYWDVWGYSWTTHQMAGLIYRYMGEHERARAAFDSSLMFLEAHKEEFEDYHGFYSALGITYAGLGRKKEAVEQGKYALSRFPVAKDALNGGARTLDLARIYVMVNEYDLAIDLLEQLMALRVWGLTPATLDLDPMWDPVRGHTRFKALIKKYDIEL